jgi:paired amphipathic helix protein Sin3a
MQILGREDHITDESISSEERWSLYVDQFVQLSATEGVNMRRREPFLKRNLPTEVGDEPPQNVETSSGLELKICVNTYKIFFVDNTEDYFRRISAEENGEREAQRHRSLTAKKNAIFREWLESEDGWKRDLEDGANTFQDWMGGLNRQRISTDTDNYSIYTVAE